MNVERWITNRFFSTWGYPIFRGYWRSQVIKSVAEPLDERSRTMCLNTVKKARNVNDLLQRLIALGQEFEMSGSLASANAKYDIYEIYLKAACDCYAFAYEHTKDSQRKEKIGRAVQETEHRLEIVKKIYKR